MDDYDDPYFNNFNNHVDPNYMNTSFFWGGDSNMATTGGFNSVQHTGHGGTSRQNIERHSDCIMPSAPDSCTAIFNNGATTHPTQQLISEAGHTPPHQWSYSQAVNPLDQSSLHPFDSSHLSPASTMDGRTSSSSQVPAPESYAYPQALLSSQYYQSTGIQLRDCVENNAYGSQPHSNQGEHHSRTLPSIGYPLIAPKPPGNGASRERYQVYGGRFRDAGEAEDHFNFRIDPDEELQLDAHQKKQLCSEENSKAYVKRLYESIVNLDGLMETTSNAYKDFKKAKVNADDIETAAWRVFTACLNLHTFGPLQRFERFSKIPAEDRQLDFNERFSHICEGLKIHKIICDDVVKHNKVEQYVHAPIYALKTKLSNKKINTERAKVLDAGKQATMNLATKRKQIESQSPYSSSNVPPEPKKRKFNRGITLEHYAATGPTHFEGNHNYEQPSETTGAASPQDIEQLAGPSHSHRQLPEHAQTFQQPRRRRPAGLDLHKGNSDSPPFPEIQQPDLTLTSPEDCSEWAKQNKMNKTGRVSDYGSPAFASSSSNGRQAWGGYTGTGSAGLFSTTLFPMTPRTDKDMRIGEFLNPDHESVEK